MKDKRRFVRFEAPLYVKCACSDRPRQFQGVAQDISMGGVKLEMDKSVDILPKKEVSLYFLLPAKTLEVAAKVAWVKDGEAKKNAGLAFLTFPDHYKEEIYRYIFTHHPKAITRKWWQS